LGGTGIDQKKRPFEHGTKREKIPPETELQQTPFAKTSGKMAENKLRGEKKDLANTV